MIVNMLLMCSGNAYVTRRNASTFYCGFDYLKVPLSILDASLHAKLIDYSFSIIHSA